MAYATCTDPACPHGRRNLAVRRAAQTVADGQTIMKLRLEVAELRVLAAQQRVTDLNTQIAETKSMLAEFKRLWDGA